MAPTATPLARPAHWVDTRVRVDKLVVGPFDNNVFIVRDLDSGEAVLIDAANEHEQLLELSRRLGVRRILETHGHWDHIQAVPRPGTPGSRWAWPPATPPCCRPTTS